MTKKISDSLHVQPRKVAICGVEGRMGQALLRCLEKEPNATLGGALTKPGSPGLHLDAGARIQTRTNVNCVDDPFVALEGASVAIDFSSPTATVRVAQAAAELRVALVCGTTGLDPIHQKALRRAGEYVPVLQAANTSIGINLLQMLVQTAAASLSKDFDIEIVEMHHRQKIDAPSGTALALGHAAATARKGSLETLSERGRDGMCGPRRSGRIGFASLRGGDVTGEHSVIFAGTGERLTLSHQVSDRRVFAIGALRAALWLAGKKPGCYRMRDVLS